MIFFDAIFEFIQRIINFFTITPVEMNRSKLQVFVKYGSTSTVPIYLENDWNIEDLKNAVALKLGLKHEELRIIFAGKELHDQVQLQDMDVGEQSIIHAFSNGKKTMSVTLEAKQPLNQVPFYATDCPMDNDPLGKGNPRKSHFFVFCNGPCKSLCPGKLRVRCSSCKEGTLTVHQDPACWEDVLTSGRITGSCQSEGCEGSVADFYFKCTKHVNAPNESAIPLPLVKNNFKEVPCIACTSVSPILIVFPCPDGHVICVECFQLYCTSRLNERRFIQDANVGYSIDCPAGCPESLITEPHHFKLLDAEQYSRYQRFGAEECVLASGGVLCPQPGCGAGILPDPECRRVTCLIEAGCGFVFCRDCMQGYHIGPCEQIAQSESQGLNYSIVDERASTSKWDDENRKVIRCTTKPCPKCRTPTERDGGCMHMVCTRSQCGFHWCWVCQEEWTRECMGNHWFG